MSSILWDTFTGSAPYSDIALRAANPAFLVGLLSQTLASLFRRVEEEPEREDPMPDDELGKAFASGDTIIQEGDSGDRMFIIRSGKVEISQRRHEKDVVLAELGPGDFFGEMALFDKETRSTTVRALEPVRLLTVDRKTLLRRFQADPSLAFRIVEKLCSRVRDLDRVISRMQSSDRRDWRTRPEDGDGGPGQRYQRK